MTTSERKGVGLYIPFFHLLFCTPCFNLQIIFWFLSSQKKGMKLPFSVTAPRQFKDSLDWYLGVILALSGAALCCHCQIGWYHVVLTSTLVGWGKLNWHFDLISATIRDCAPNSLFNLFSLWSFGSVWANSLRIFGNWIEVLLIIKLFYLTSIQFFILVTF